MNAIKNNNELLIANMIGRNNDILFKFIREENQKLSAKIHILTTELNKISLIQAEDRGRRSFIIWIIGSVGSLGTIANILFFISSK